jgi:hypothetical protein
MILHTHSSICCPYACVEAPTLVSSQKCLMARDLTNCMMTKNSYDRMRMYRMEPCEPYDSPYGRMIKPDATLNNQL